ncbi:hypothetical protein BDV26DRAFT_284480 [Aspergillus bertholletiae]|uniref:NAD(P)-binding protein n=1 Tax=Aspergillus bertholletiae TaxID=1226010 RepID=A0A5N7AWI5_9EURO|nr:hypothetical protein BDV26DRAFT_284480 [Aspergillus bertholletiae]
MPRIWFITGCSSGFGRELAIGPIDILEGAVEECSHDEVAAQFDTNVFSQIRVLRAVLPYMRARKSGVVANFGSIGGWNGMPAAGLYCAGKAAVAIYTESLAAELAPFNIDVIYVEPGYCRTSLLTEGHKMAATKRIPELQAGTQQARDTLAAYSLKQPGDPAKGAQVLREQEMMDTWREIIMSTDCDDVRE